LVDKHLPKPNRGIFNRIPHGRDGQSHQDGDAPGAVVFIGPCVAKKAEAERYRDLVDFVLTFEELASIFVGAGINVAEVAAEAGQTAASCDGVAFARAGGVTQAVCHTVACMAPSAELKPLRAEGLADCQAVLAKMQQGILDANFFEGMVPGRLCRRAGQTAISA
jgi:iron only hydrogenase large subunit-like protein